MTAQALASRKLAAGNVREVVLVRIRNPGTVQPFVIAALRAPPVDSITDAGQEVHDGIVAKPIGQARASSDQVLPTAGRTRLPPGA